MAGRFPSRKTAGAHGNSPVPAEPGERIAVIDPTRDARWELLVRNRRSDVFHSPAWMRVLQQTYDLDIRAHIVPGNNDTPSAGFVFVAIDDLLGRRMISLPFSDHCDPMVDDADQWAWLSGDMLEARTPVVVKVLFDEVAEQDPRLVESSRARWHRADTTPDPDAMWRRLHPSARRAIRKSEASNVRVRPAQTLGDVRAFFDLHLCTRKHKYHLLAQPWAFLEAIWEHFIPAGQGQILLAEHGSSILGGVLFLRWQDTLYYKLNASDNAALALRPNDAVLWAGMHHAHASGLRWLDFGVSAVDQEGLIRYKRKYATEERDVRVLRNAAAAADRRSQEMRDLLPQLTRLFVRPDVPDDVTEMAGRALYRYFA